ncbi:hypothetical protein RBA41_31310 [Massilia sp. CCM 9210]|uniref:hypothetical protein n=1 Tax=Massilia scottii TaxID=3057166 RepID=UPI0027966C96|nr:hypothetical protein [Massilia sp. CCM 9210]MDQ1817799.1 hypothetical protein [Massilia sp. CCM 9210]
MNNSRSVTVSGIIRKRLSEFEQRMYEGESQTSIVSDLNEKDGITISLKNFRQLLSRARKAAQKKLTLAEPVQQPVTTALPPEIAKVEKETKANPEKERPPLNEKSKRSKMSLNDMNKLLNESLDLDNI